MRKRCGAGRRWTELPGGMQGGRVMLYYIDFRSGNISRCKGWRPSSLHIMQRSAAVCCARG